MHGGTLALVTFDVLFTMDFDVFEAFILNFGVPLNFCSPREPSSHPWPCGDTPQGPHRPLVLEPDMTNTMELLPVAGVFQAC